MGQETTVPLDNKRPPARGSRVFGTFAAIVAVLLLAVFAWRILAGGAPAPVPAMFDTSLTLADANARATDQQKLVFAFVTADWCGPCQAFKRGALADARVQEWVAANTVPVYIDVDKHPQAAASLRIQSIPTTVLLRDGEPVASLLGGASADELLAWAEESAGL